MLSVQEALEKAAEKAESSKKISELFQRMQKDSVMTFDHSFNVAKLSYFLGRELGLNEKKIMDVTLAGLLHDIGKMQVPLDILNSKETYSKDEFYLMKRHPEYAYDILRDERFSGKVSRAVLEHHENMDGTGYPEGKRGARISLYGRILRVADVAEALQSDRMYRVHYDLEKTCELMSKDRGTVYDEEILDCFLKISGWEGS